MSNRRNSFMELDKPKDGDGAFKSKKQSRKKVIILISLAILLIGIGIGSVSLFSSDVFSPKTHVTVSFDSTGGSEIESRSVLKGTTLNEIGSPTRSGFVFAGWYYEEAPVNAYNADDRFNEDTTLFAAWYEPEMESDIQEYLKDSDSNITFAVHSEAALTDANLSDYISCYCMDIDEEYPLSVKPQEDGYLLYSEDGFTPGFTYSIELLDTKTVSFIKAGDEIVTNQGIRVYNFTVYKENINNVTMKAEPKLLSIDDVSHFEAAGEVADGETGNENDNGKTIDRAYLVNNDGEYQVGDIISLGNGEKNAPENEYYKVIHVEKNNTGHYLDLIAPNMDDIYSEFEVYYSGDAVRFEETEKDEQALEFEQSLQTSLQESEGYDYLCTAIARGIKESPTLRDTIAALDVKHQQRFQQLSLNDIVNMLKNVKVDLSIQKTYDIANNENGVRGIVSFSTGDIGIKLDDNIYLTLNLTLTNDITETAYGYISLQDRFKVNINKGALLTNHCNLNFSAVIGTGSGEKKVNITQEIQNLINSTSGDKTQAIVDSMNQENFFGQDLSYVEIFNKELGNKTVAIYEILTIQFKLNFHVDIGMRVGLNLNFDSTEVRRIGLCNMQALTGQSGMVTVNQRVSSHTHFTAVLKGQIGIRAGFKAEINFSLFHLNKVANFGFSVDVGVYEEITGFVRFDYDSETGMSMAGGIKSETGIYLEIDFSWYLFGWDGSVTIASFKFPILTIGTLEFVSEFESSDNAITFNTTSYNIKNSSDSLLKLKYVDISTSSTGVTINVKPASLSDDYQFFKMQDQTGKAGKEDLKYVTVDPDTGMIAIADNAPERLDFTVVVQYTKGCSLFSDGITPITKSINFTYMKYKVDDSTQKCKAVFHAPDGNVLEEKEYYVGQIPVAPAEDVYEDLFILTPYKIKDWSKPWIEEIKPIYSNTDYHLDYESNYKNITYYGDVYNDEMDTYQYGVIATVPSLCGERPIPPSPEDMDIEPGWVFDSWSPELRTVQADCNYSAVYRQDPGYCLYHFYVNGSIISSGLVKIGETPVAPDMSTYNAGDQKFIGWWPLLGPTNDNYQIYQARFRSYVNVTFKDRDGNILSEERILAGTKPEAPKVDDIVEGEEDYYEYHFNRWESEEGTKIDQVYRDTVYSPVYDKKYLEVTTIFEAGNHTFADGTKVQKYKGVYATSEFATPHILNLPEVIYKDNENTYSVDYWQSTKKVNGSYVKLDMSKGYTYYKYSLTFTPVFKAKPIEYTVWFYGGDEDITLTGHFGDVITLDMLSGLKKTSNNDNYVYKIKDYGLTLPYRFGTVIGADGLPAVYIGVVARFEAVGVDKTFAFDANGGEFADHTTVKNVTVPYGTRTSFNEVPVKADDSEYTYTFVGWSDDKNATTGSSYSDFVINGDKTIYAVYSKALRDYTITFDAGEGHYSGGVSTVNQTYHYGDTIVPPDDPVRDADAVYRYVFIGWQPELPAGTTVSASCTYTAAYRAIRVDGTLEETGVIVSDGSSYEDICANHISGYTYALIGIEAVPTLTVTGNGLSFSGASDEVCVVIEAGVTEVTFNSLTLSGAYSGSGVLTAASTTSRLTINISGACVFNNTQTGEQGARFERPVQLSGVGSGASITVSAKGSYSVYCADDFDIDSLELVVNSTNTAIGNDEGAGEDWRFTDSTIRLNAGSTAYSTLQSITLDNCSLTAVGESGINCAGMVVSGASIVDVTASGEDVTAIGAANDLTFADFTGTFSAGSTHLTSPGIAVIANGSIIFKEGGTVVSADGYDLGGTQVAVFDDGYSGTYSSFGIHSGASLVPASTVTVTKR